MRQAGEAPGSHISPEVDTDAGLTAARTVGAPHFIAEVLCRASVRWYSTDPPNFERMFSELDEAIRLHESVGASSMWDWLALT